LADTAIVRDGPRGSTGRYLFVDALRGIAALAVFLYHLLRSPMVGPFSRILPRPLFMVTDFGARGVQVFFVISGFVIAHSVCDILPNTSGVGRFILRRQLRLDPPYWLFLAITTLAIAIHVPGLSVDPMPSVGGFVANAFYLQRFARVNDVVGVSWTLSLEIQFYLLFILILAVGDARSPGSNGPGPLAIGLVFVSGLACLLDVRNQYIHSNWFFSFWSYFVLGALCHWATHGLMPKALFAGYAAAFARAILVAGNMSSFMITGLATALVLYVAADWDKMREWSGGIVLQYLGRISYSLYLVHTSIIKVIVRKGYALTGEREWPALGWYLLTIVVTMIFASLFHRVIEVPSTRWSARLKRRSVRFVNAPVRPTTEILDVVGGKNPSHGTSFVPIDPRDVNSRSNHVANLGELT